MTIVLTTVSDDRDAAVLEPVALEPAASRLLQAVVEIVSADRPLIQLLRWTTPEVYAQLAAQARGVLRATGASDRAQTGRPRVVSVHVFRPRDDVAEVSGRVRHDGRSRAVAARLERHRDRWVCTALQLG